MPARTARLTRAHLPDSFPAARTPQQRKDGDATVVTGELRSKVDRVWDAFWS